MKNAYLQMIKTAWSFSGKRKPDLLELPELVVGSRLRKMAKDALKTRKSELLDL